jgi:hypothetical protein
VGVAAFDELGVETGRVVGGAVPGSLSVLLSLAEWLSLTGMGEPADPLAPPPVNAATAITATIAPTITAKAPRTSTVMAGAANLRFGTAVSFRSRTHF